MDKERHVQVASPPDRRVTTDDIAVSASSPTTGSEIENANASTSCTSANTGTTHSHNPPSPGRNGQLSKQGTLTIVRRSSAKGKGSGIGNVDSPTSTDNPETYSRGQSVDFEEILENVDLETDSLPAVDTPDACDKAALRLRCLLRQLQHGEISADLLQRNLHYAARVLEAVFIDETKVSSGESTRSSRRGAGHSSTGLDNDGPQSHAVATQKRKLRTPVWARLRNIHIPQKKLTSATPALTSFTP